MSTSPTLDPPPVAGVGADAAARATAHEADLRVGTLAGVAAYSLWGVFPLVFHLLRSVAPTEVLVHRIVWSLAVVLVVLAVRRERHWFRAVRRLPGALPRLALAALLIAVNWGVYIWAVNNDHVVETSLGYYINPILSVLVGVVFLRERLAPLQW